MWEWGHERCRCADGVEEDLYVRDDDEGGLGVGKVGAGEILSVGPDSVGTDSAGNGQTSAISDESVERDSPGDSTEQVCAENNYEDDTLVASEHGMFQDRKGDVNDCEIDGHADTDPS